MTITRKVRLSKLPLKSNQSLFAESFNQQPKTSRAIPPSMMLLGATCTPEKLPGPNLKRITRAMRHDAAPRIPQIVPPRSSCCWKRFMGEGDPSYLDSVASDAARVVCSHPVEAGLRRALCEPPSTDHLFYCSTGLLKTPRARRKAIGYQVTLYFKLVHVRTMPNDEAHRQRWTVAELPIGGAPLMQHS